MATDLIAGVDQRGEESELRPIPEGVSSMETKFGGNARQF